MTAAGRGPRFKSWVGRSVMLTCRCVLFQAITKEAGYSVGQNRSGASQLAAWAVTSLTLRSKADCHTIALAGLFSHFLHISFVESNMQCHSWRRRDLYRHHVCM